jgi:hypothetical protein
MEGMPEEFVKDLQVLIAIAKKMADKPLDPDKWHQFSFCFKTDGVTDEIGAFQLVEVNDGL